MSTTHNTRGFTLIELSIVLVIIGLVVAGITVGQHLARTSDINKMVVELGKQRSAVQQFKTAYHALPGDMHNATSYWSGTTNGDGDWVINMEDENLHAWAHLQSAGLIAGYETAWFGQPKNILTALVTELFGIPSAFAECSEVTPGEDIPSTSGISNGGYFLTEVPEPVHGKTGNAILVGTLEGVAPSGLRGPVVAPQEAYRIDKKLDDGVATKGGLMSDKGVMSNIECLDNGDYDTVNDTGDACYLVFWL